jgi:hypothetical protein
LIKINNVKFFKNQMRCVTPDMPAILNTGRLGRPSKLTDAQKTEARRRRAKGATFKELAENYDVVLATISRLVA